MRKNFPFYFPALSTHYRAGLAALALLACGMTANAQSGMTITTSGTQKITTIGATGQLVDSNVTLSGSTAITQATVTISSGYATGDVLSFSNAALPSGVTGSFVSGTGVLTFTGSATPAQYQSLLRTVNISLASSSATTRAVTFSLGNMVSYTNGHYYEFVTSTMTWANAKTAAAGRSYNGLTGYLATITSAGENAFIKQTLSADGWIGASDDYVHITAAGVSTYSNQAASEGHWYWVTGPEMGTNFSNGNGSSLTAVSGQYSNWNPGEPNNSGTGEHYGEIYSSSGNSGAWNDLSSTNSLGYVVEYGGLPGDPVVQLSATRLIVVQATSVLGTGNNGNYKTNTVRKVDSLVEVRSVSSITNARVTISSGFRNGDTLGFSSAALPSGVTGSYNITTGVLSFTGTATAAQFQSLFRTVTFKATSGNYLNREVTFSIGNLVAYTNGNFYEFVPATAISWSSAKTAAAGRTYLGKTGYLATITSAGENAFIKQTMSVDGWVGGSDAYQEINAATGTNTYSSQSASEGHWYWVTGPEKGTNISNGNAPSMTPVNGVYNNWSSGEPNNSGSNENYMQIYASGNNSGTWNDLNGTSQNGYVVEYGGLTSDPAVTLSSTTLMMVRGDVLPLSDIRLSAAGDRKTLCWNTLNEDHVDHLSLERSADGRSFDLVAAQTSQGKGSFSYCQVDAGQPAGKTYYRVAAVDADGSVRYSNIVSVAGNPGQAALSLAPNPVRSVLSVERGSDGPASLSVLDLAGRVLMEENISGFHSRLDLSRLPAGSYHLLLRDASGQTSRLITKQ